MKIALYARVSTTDKGQDPEMQLRELREYCERRKLEIVREYVDNGISGSKESRPELNRLMADANRGKFSTVLVWKFDRFARSTSHLLKALETFQTLKIDFVSLTEGIDTSTPVGAMVFTILGAVGQMEHELIRERIRAGVRNARAKGKKLGRPRVAVNAAALASMRAAGQSYRAMATALGVSVGSVHSAVQQSL
jgi:DNA invertase Pin-like site-specific DNA recombinase